MKASLSSLFEEIHTGKLINQDCYKWKTFQPSLSSSIHFVNPPDPTKHDHSSEQTICSESWMMHPNSGKNLVSMNMENNHSDMLPSLTNLRSSSQFSTISRASNNSALKYVYQRKKPQNQYEISSTGQASINKESGVFSSAVCSGAKILSDRDENTIPECQRHVGVSNIQPTAVNSCAVFSCRALQACVPKELPKRNIRRSGQNHVYPSKSNLNVGADSANINVYKTGETSSLLLGAANQTEAISEKDFCISVLRCHGLLGNGHNRTSCAGEATIGTYASRSCTTCGRCENTKNLLICDDCDRAFHAWCCHPRVTDIPVEEWFCNSCVKEQQKLLKEMKLRKLQNITAGEAGNNVVDASDIVLTCIDIMLLDTEPHKTEVRVGKGFQADVPEWSEPNPSDSDLVGEALEIGLPESERLHNSRLHNPAKVSPIGNWLQCREVIRGIREDIDGNVCGKWRRAPLSKVQSDDWDCFSAVLWDPAHADCAAPQELETEEVMKQLKYIQMLKPTSTGKRQKLSHPRRKAL